MAPDEAHPGDFFDEAEQDAFFLTEGGRKMDCQEEFSTLLHADDGVAFLVHLARECTGHYAWIDSTLHYRHMYPRAVQLSMTKRRRGVRLLEVSNMDAMLGRVEDVGRAIREACRAPGTRLVVLVSSCVAEVTGMQLRDVLEQESEAAAVPAVFLELTVDENTPLEQFWSQVMRLARTDVTREPRSVVLVGLGEEDSPFAAEARAVLQRFGVRLRGLLLPGFDTGTAERFCEAGLAVVSSAEAVAQEFRLARRRLEPHVRFAELDPPFGPAGTRRFYRRVLAACGVRRSAAGLAESWEPLRADWERWRRRASGYAAAVVVAPEEAEYLSRPRRLYGLDLVGLLREMGFRVRVLCTPRRASDRAAELAAALRVQLRARLGPDDGLEVAVGGGGEGIEAELARTDAALVFTEYPPDRRITGAGRMSFHPRDFEPGFEGALRTLVRLTRLAESRFHRSCRGLERR